MGEAVEQSRRHFGVAEDIPPLAEAQVGGDDHAGPLVEFAEQVKQQGPARCAERQVAQLIEDEEIETEQALGELSGLVGGLLLFEQMDQVRR